MKLNIQSYRGIKSAELNITPLTLIAGKNHQGKSAIAGAAGALLTGNSHPDWIKKKDLAEFVNDDAETGKIELITEDGSASIVYPTAKFSTTGTPPRASRVAAGLDSPLNMSDRERSKYFSELLKTEPTIEQLTEAVKDAGMPEDTVKKLWDKIQMTGWDSAHKEAGTRGSDIKGSWKHVTGGETYGVNKAADWKPEGWTPRLEDVSADDIQTKITEIQKERDAVIRATAHDEGETERLQELANGLDVATKTHKDNCAMVDQRVAELKVLTDSVPELLSMDDQDCPECGKPLQVKGGTIVKGGGVTKAQVTAAIKARSTHQKKITKAEEKLASAREGSVKSSALTKDCEVARDVLAKLVVGDFGGRTPEDIDAEIAGLNRDRGMILMRNDARKYHRQIEKNAVIVAALAPDGLRKEVLEQGLGGFNGCLSAVCNDANWPIVSVNNDLSIVYGGRDYRLLSESEQYRVRATVLIACAWNDDSEVTIFDGADILDKTGRNGLIQAINGSEADAIVVMTYPDREGVPDMSRIGGETVWIEDGEVA